MRFLILLSMLLVSDLGLVYADEAANPTTPMTLLSAHQMALQHDATLRAAKADNRAQQEEIDKARAAFLPQARLALYQGRASTDSRTPGFLGRENKAHTVYDSKNYNLSVRQSIFNMSSYAQFGQAKSEARRSDAVLDSAITSLMSRVSGAYFDMLLSAENIDYLEAQKTSIEGQLKQAQARYQSGFGTLTEISEAKANFESSVAKQIEYVNALENAKRALENLTGTYPNHFFKLDPLRLSLDPLQPGQVEEWIADGLEKNPDLLAEHLAITSAQYEIDKSQSGHFPTLDLVASRTDTESDTNYTIGSKYSTDSVGLQLNVPLYFGGYVNSTVRQANAKLEEAQEKAEERQREVSANIRKYFNEVTNGLARIKAFTEVVHANEVALAGTQKGFAAGIRSNVEVLNAQEKLYSAKRDLAKERYQLIYNRLILKQYSGLLKDADIEEISHLFTLPAATDMVATDLN